MVQGRWIPVGSDLSEPMGLRRQIFGCGQDALDAMAQQVVVYEAGQPVGAARLWWQDGAFWLGSVGVLEEKRGLGYGDLLVRLLLFKSLTHSASVIRLVTPPHTEPFFAKYGFVVTQTCPDGSSVMSIDAADVHLSHCGGNCAECSRQTEECIPKALR